MRVYDTSYIIIKKFKSELLSICLFGIKNSKQGITSDTYVNTVLFSYHNWFDQTTSGNLFK